MGKTKVKRGRKRPDGRGTAENKSEERQEKTRGKRGKR
jgi:hypothetical protein